MNMRRPAYRDEPLPDIARVTAALAHPSRTAMCSALMDGRAWTVGELSAYAGITRSTGSEHVNALAGAGLVRKIRQGRHTYVVFSGDDVVRIVEGLGVIAATQSPSARSLRAWTQNHNLREARTCYRHLAGRLGVRLADRMRARGYLDGAWQLSPRGRKLVASWGLTFEVVPRGEACMDSIERRFHLGGKLGAALTELYLEHRWIVRKGQTRAVELTESGEKALEGASLAERWTTAR